MLLFFTKKSFASSLNSSVDIPSRSKPALKQRVFESSNGPRRTNATFRRITRNLLFFATHLSYKVILSIWSLNTFRNSG